MSFKKKINEALSGDNQLKILDKHYLPRWIVVFLDIMICVFSILCTYFILWGSPIKFLSIISVAQQGAIYLVVTICFFFIFKTYSGIVRHSTFTDILKLALATFNTALALIVLNIIFSFVYGEKIFLTSSIILYSLFCFTFLLLFRIAVKEGYNFLKQSSNAIQKKRIAIYGLDDDTIMLGNAITKESHFPFELMGFMAEDVSSKRYKILGKPVVPVKKNLEKAIKILDIEGVLFINEAHSGQKKRMLTEKFIENGLEIFSVPALTNWQTVEQLEKKIKPIQIEDLLDRAPIETNISGIQNDLEGKTILVTGGAGSIGSEIVRQVASFNPKHIVILDQSEFSLYKLEMELAQRFPSLKFTTELANISNMYRLEWLFKKYDFQIIYHAAAYKHVPLIERNPHEAIYVNILGTVNLSILAVKNNIEKFVMVSTDKAVNPTNVMGASKRAGEMYVQALQEKEGVKTSFITTRFGNVLGSSGSVIPLFRKQIAQGGPVTLTHTDIIRYFMTIPEACQLVLQAGTMGKGGEIYVFDMGEPVKIYDLAKRMIRLSGFTTEKDIEIKVTGLRPGEKLYEELLTKESITLPTHHPKIMIVKDEPGNFKSIKKSIKQIIAVATSGEEQDFIKLLKDLVPEFKSENSKFETLD